MKEAVVQSVKTAREEQNREFQQSKTSRRWKNRTRGDSGCQSSPPSIVTDFAAKEVKQFSDMCVCVRVNRLVFFFQAPHTSLTQPTATP